jgi:D-alanyl-D-alanine carboxypeptidase (penicillin-binding protein 5/6)
MRNKLWLESRLVLGLWAILALALAPSAADAYETPAKAAILVDHDTGQVLYEKNADLPLPPASMSKLMTAYMVFERLKDGRLTLDDEFPVSEKAWRKGG